MSILVSPQNPWTQVSEVVRLIRSGSAQTRPELAEATRLGRNVVTLRIQAAQELGLVQPSGDLRSRGGRAAEIWEFQGAAGHILVVIQGFSSFRVVLTDLGLRVLDSRWVQLELSEDPRVTCQRMATEMESLLAAHEDARLWGIGLGMLAPVDFTTGRSTDPVTSVAGAIRWPRDFDVRQWFSTRMHAPVWVEAVANLMALGAASAPEAPADLVFVRMARGVGSGIVSGGRLHRGADWLAGEITHVVVRPDPDRVCMCGRLGCLDAFAGEWAVETAARRAIAEHRSSLLAEIGARDVTVEAVVAGAEFGDLACVEIVLQAADALGRTLASVVTWFNPRRVVIGGNALAMSAMFQSAMRRTLNAQSLPASVEHLEIQVGDRDRSEEVRGATVMVRDALLSPDYLVEWGPAGAPSLAAGLQSRPTQS